MSINPVNECVSQDQTYSNTRPKEELIIMEKQYKRIKLNERTERDPAIDGYSLNPANRYVINLEDEIESQAAIMMSFQIMGFPPGLKNYHAWLLKNGFNVDAPNPTNEFVAQYYGVKPLWKTDYSQGVVVKAENDSDYYIVMECSGMNKGYKKTEIILTLAGCV